VKAALLFSLLCCTARGVQPDCTAIPTTTAEFDIEMCWADYYAQAYGVPLEFVQAVIDVESAWHPYAISAKGAAGLMQLMPPTAFTFGVTNRFLIPENIRGGVAYLAYLMRRFEGELRLGVAEDGEEPANTGGAIVGRRVAGLGEDVVQEQRVGLPVGADDGQGEVIAAGHRGHRRERAHGGLDLGGEQLLRGGELPLARNARPVSAQEALQPTPDRHAPDDIGARRWDEACAGARGGTRSVQRLRRSVPTRPPGP